MKLIKRTSQITALLCSMTFFVSSAQAGELVKAETVNNADFTLIAHEMVKDSLTLSTISMKSPQNDAQALLAQETEKQTPNSQQVAKVLLVAE